MWQLYWASHFPPVSYIIKSFRRVYLGFQISRKGWVITHCWMEVYTGSLKTLRSDPFEGQSNSNYWKHTFCCLLLFTFVSIKDRWLTNLRDTNISSRLQLNFHQRHLCCHNFISHSSSSWQGTNYKGQNVLYKKKKTIESFARCKIYLLVLKIF